MLTHVKFPQIENRQLKRKRLEDEGTTIIPFEKRSRISIPQPHTEDTTCEKEMGPVEYWTKEYCWPKEYFDPEAYIFKPEGYTFDTEGNMIPRFFARTKSSSASHGKQSEAGSSASSIITPSDQQPREIKSAPYQNSKYKTFLELKGSFMRESKLGISDTSKIVCRTLFEAEQILPEDSLFRDDLFKKTCKMIQDRNEAKVIQDIARLIVPSAESLATHGAKHLTSLIESVNEGWNSSIALTQTRPQPDYAVGFNRTAFTNDQLEKIKVYIGDLGEMSYFLGTFYMFFPFLTCEVKCGAAALEIADRQNAHSMSLAVRGIVYLFTLIKREKELHREILAFSISHDHEFVKIYGHYPIINGEGQEPTFYRHLIHAFNFTALDGKEKWTAYKVVRNIYDLWMPNHLERIRSAIDDIPSGLNFDISSVSLGTGLSQGLESHNIFEQASDGVMSLQEANGQLSRLGSERITPDTLLSQEIDAEGFTRPTKRGRQ